LTVTARTCLTIGNFDGVHVGHAALVRRCRDLASTSGASVVVMSFDPHPASVLRPELSPARLTTFEQRERSLRRLGADRVVRLDPDSGILEMSPEQFVDRVVMPHRPIAAVEGRDFCFGRGRAGTTDTLSSLGASRGFTCDVVPPVVIDLDDQLLAPASSSLVRWLLSNGRVRDAARVLGRPYELEGVVARGDQRGRTIGYPTINLRVASMLPADGVYAGCAILADGTRHLAAINVGRRPTFAGIERRLEAHLVRADGTPVDSLPEYDWPVRVELHSWIRDDLKFESVPSLVAQLGRDVRSCLAAMRLSPHRPPENS
jgi:riboflavin kinase / FMN adenylyltransferase